jgi:hypothetical protein
VVSTRDKYGRTWRCLPYELANKLNRSASKISQTLRRTCPALCCNLVKTIEKKIGVASSPRSNKMVRTRKAYAPGVTFESFGGITLSLVISEV